MHSRATDRRSASKCQGKWPDQTSTKRSGYPRCGSGQHLASVLQEGRENANIDAGLGFIWRISAKIHRHGAGGRTMAVKVFISYRRADSAGYAGRVMD